MGVLRLSEQDEILGGDLHYFGPIEFYGNPKDYDLVEIMQKQIVLSSAKKVEEGDEEVLEGGEDIELSTAKKPIFVLSEEIKNE